MKFRFYQLYHLLVAALLCVCLFMPLMRFVEGDGATFILTNFNVISPDGSSSASSWALGALLIFSVVLSLFAIFVSLFQNFTLQKRCTILNMLILAGYYIVFAIMAWVMHGDMGFVPEVYLAFPLISILLELIAFWATRRAEANVLEKAMGFRLRD